MKLYEFFSKIDRSVNPEDKDKDPSTLNQEEEQHLADDLFWFIIDHDDLHKQHFMPKAKELKAAHSADKSDSTKDWKHWLPMVKEGCIRYFEQHHVPGDPKETFNQEFMKTLCRRCAEHYHKDIIKGEYKLGH
jgi:hypothetical protein